MKWLCIGDSITEKNFRTKLNYHDYVATAMNLTVINDGLSGTGFLRDFEGNPAYPKRLNRYNPAPEIITVFGSFNDLEEESTYKENMVGILTITMESYFQTLIEMYPLSFIGVISPTPWAKYHGPNYYVNCLKKAAENYNLPYLDLYNGTSLRPWIQESNKKFFSCPESPDGDGTHPNEEGHRLMAQPIEAFLRAHLPHI